MWLEYRFLDTDVDGSFFLFLGKFPKTYVKLTWNGGER